MEVLIKDYLKETKNTKLFNGSRWIYWDGILNDWVVRTRVYFAGNYLGELLYSGNDFQRAMPILNNGLG